MPFATHCVTCASSTYVHIYFVHTAHSDAHLVVRVHHVWGWRSLPPTFQASSFACAYAYMCMLICKC